MTGIFGNFYGAWILGLKTLGLRTIGLMEKGLNGPFLATFGYFLGNIGKLFIP